MLVLIVVLVLIEAISPLFMIMYSEYYCEIFDSVRI